MTVFSLAVQAIQFPQGGPIMDLETSPYNNARISEIGIQAWGGTGSLAEDVAIGLASNTPVAQFSMPLMSEFIVGRQSVSTIAVLWTTAPTVPANFFRRASFAAGSFTKFYIWTFPRGLTIPAGSSMVMWGLGLTANLVQGWWIIEE